MIKQVQYIITECASKSVVDSEHNLCTVMLGIEATCPQNGDTWHFGGTVTYPV